MLLGQFSEGREHRIEDHRADYDALHHLGARRAGRRGPFDLTGSEPVGGPRVVLE
jgi:hypothetical protein